MYDTNTRPAVIPNAVYELLPWWWPSTNRNMSTVNRWCFVT